jgi:predicted metal-dependent peptidase
MPTYKDENIQNLFMAMDLSSSVSEEEIQKAQDILDDIRQLYSIENTVVITFNHEIIDRLEFAEYDDINFSDLDAGGGTCIDNVFEYIEQNGDSPFTLLLVSDMEDYIETKSVPYPVIWLNTDERGEAFLGEKPNFGKLINVHDLV